MIKTLIDILRESRDASKERLKLSIVLIYLTILAFFYWKPISIYLFSNQSIELRIKEIEKIYFKYENIDFIWNLLYVLLISLISSIIFPIVMLIIDYLLKTPNNQRKIIKNNSKDIDREEELKITSHKYELNKILSGNKEVEDYNKSIEDLKKSYEDRIQNIESISNQKESNSAKQIDNVTKENYLLQAKLNEINTLNHQLREQINMFRMNELEYSNFSKFNKIFENKEKFNNYINEIEPYTDDIIFVKQLLKQILDLNLHSLLNRLAIAVYNGDEYLNLNVKTAKYNIEKGFIENNNLGVKEGRNELIEKYFVGKSMYLIEHLVSLAENFSNN